MIIVRRYFVLYLYVNVSFFLQIGYTILRSTNFSVRNSRLAYIFIAYYYYYYYHCYNYYYYRLIDVIFLIIHRTAKLLYIMKNLLFFIRQPKMLYYTPRIELYIRYIVLYIYIIFFFIKLKYLRLGFFTCREVYCFYVHISEKRIEIISRTRKVL